MDIEHFYDGNPKRRTSREYTFGTDWTDQGGVRWEINWVEDTGELYAMREPTEPLIMDPFGDTQVASLPADEVTVEILTSIADLAAVEATLDGWSAAEKRPASLEWVRERIRDGAPGGDQGARHHDPEPDSLPGSD